MTQTHDKVEPNEFTRAVWYAKGAEALELSGEVHQADCKAVLNAQSSVKG